MNVPFSYDYICLLDPGCGRQGHSLHCQEKNVEREKALRSKERRRRLQQFEKDIADDSQG